MTIENHSNVAEDDRVYGYEKRGNTNFIVTSWIADWRLNLKQAVNRSICSSVLKASYKPECKKNIIYK